MTIGVPVPTLDVTYDAVVEEVPPEAFNAYDAVIAKLAVPNNDPV